MEALLLSYGARPTAGPSGEDRHEEAESWLGISPLHEAARTRDLAEAKTLLDAGADLTARDEHLRFDTARLGGQFGQVEMVTLLLRHGAPKRLPDDPPWTTPLAWAVGRGHQEIARLLS